MALLKHACSCFVVSALQWQYVMRIAAVHCQRHFHQLLEPTEPIDIAKAAPHCSDNNHVFPLVHLTLPACLPACLLCRCAVLFCDVCSWSQPIASALAKAEAFVRRIQRPDGSW
jgi:hypothetical protein